MIGVLLHGWRNFARNLHRYRVLILALVAISAVFVVVLGTILGLYGSIRAKASRYFAGDIAVYGFIGDGSSLIEEPAAVMNAIVDALQS